ncbi:MAG: hypothetical protein ACP5N9_04150 [Candidatus Bilamarchaeum sp.]|jgi:hypothetical protein
MSNLAYDNVSQFKPSRRETDEKLFGGKKLARKEPLKEDKR